MKRGPADAARAFTLAALCVLCGCYGEEQYTALPADDAFESPPDGRVFPMTGRRWVVLDDAGDVRALLRRRRDSNAVKKPYAVLWLKNESRTLRITDFRCGPDELRLGDEVVAGNVFHVDASLDFEGSMTDEPFPLLERYPEPNDATIRAAVEAGR